MVTSDFRPEVEIRPFHACAMKNTQYNPMAESAKLTRLSGNRGHGTPSGVRDKPARGYTILFSGCVAHAL